MNEPVPLLFLPGLMNDAQVWQPAIAKMAGHECRIADTSKHASVTELAIAALTDAPCGRFALVGFSLGGYIAFEILRLAPERVAALALIGTSARPDSRETIAMRERMIAAVSSGTADFNMVASAFLPRIVHSSRIEDMALNNLLISMARNVGAEGFIRQQRAAIGRPDSRPLLKQIRCKTLVVCGREDQVTPPDCSQEMASGSAQAELTILEQCGHMAPLEQPNAVNKAFSHWLNSV
ncbi:MAG TPA: alpha/beta hydrolase [Noviherbaspirillum sp.]